MMVRVRSMTMIIIISITYTLHHQVQAIRAQTYGTFRTQESTHVTDVSWSL
jgi:hypothetical protein